MVINGTDMKTKARNSHAKAVRRRSPPNIVNGTVPPRRQFNVARRPREYLTAKEVELLRKGAHGRGRNRHRDATMILVAFRHGLRPIEVCSLRWDQIDLAQGLLHVQRVKGGMPSVHPMGGGEIRELRRLKREQPQSRHVFLSERTAPMTTAGFRKMLARTGDGVEFPFPVHPHMLRHACGYKLANDGQDTRALQHYLGHKNIQHTVRYTELSPDRFKSFWED